LTENIYHGGVDPTVEMSPRTTRHKVLMDQEDAVYRVENKWILDFVSDAQEK